MELAVVPEARKVEMPNVQAEVCQEARIEFATVCFDLFLIWLNACPNQGLFSGAKSIPSKRLAVCTMSDFPYAVGQIYFSKQNLRKLSLAVLFLTVCNSSNPKA